MESRTFFKILIFSIKREKNDDGVFNSQCSVIIITWSNIYFVFWIFLFSSFFVQQIYQYQVDQGFQCIQRQSWSRHRLYIYIYKWFPHSCCWLSLASIFTWFWHEEKSKQSMTNDVTLNTPPKIKENDGKLKEQKLKCKLD